MMEVTAEQRERLKQILLDVYEDEKPLSDAEHDIISLFTEPLPDSLSPLVKEQKRELDERDKRICELMKENEKMAHKLNKPSKEPAIGLTALRILLNPIPGAATNAVTEDYPEFAELVAEFHEMDREKP